MFEMWMKEYTVIRRVSDVLDERNHGLRVDYPENSFIINASRQIPKAEDLQLLPEGYRTSTVYTLFTYTKLQSAQAGFQLPDLVIVDNDSYIVERVDDFQNFVVPSPLNHYRVLIRLDNSGTPISQNVGL